MFSEIILSKMLMRMRFTLGREYGDKYWDVCTVIILLVVDQPRPPWQTYKFLPIQTNVITVEGPPIFMRKYQYSQLGLNLLPLSNTRLSHLWALWGCFVREGFDTVAAIVQGVLSLVSPLKVQSSKKLILARLGVSRLIYVNVDSPNLGFLYFKL